MENGSENKRSERYYVGVDKLAAGAMICLINNGEKAVTFRRLREYGAEVVRILRQGEIEAVLIFSLDSARGMMRSCSDIFNVDDPDSIDGKISLKDGKTVDDIAKRFYGSVSLAVLDAMMSEDALGVLRGDVA